MPKYLDPSKPCACSSGKTHAACCRPYLRGEQEAPDAVSLMRSRYSAFALENAAYLLRTLHASLPERAQPESEMLTLLRRACRAYDYPGLQILEEKTDGAKAEVLFLAQMFKQGKDESFLERSEFALENGRWFYTTGKMRRASEVEAPTKVTFATFVPGKDEGDEAVTV